MFFLTFKKYFSVSRNFSTQFELLCIFHTEDFQSLGTQNFPPSNNRNFHENVVRIRNQSSKNYLHWFRMAEELHLRAKNCAIRETVQRKCDHETVRLHGWNEIKTADPCAHETTAITIMNNIRASIERLDVQSQNDAEESNQFRWMLRGAVVCMCLCACVRANSPQYDQKMVQCMR